MKFVLGLFGLWIYSDSAWRMFKKWIFLFLKKISCHKTKIIFQNGLGVSETQKRTWVLGVPFYL